MSKVKNEKYGIISCNAEVEALKKMGIQERNIYWTGNSKVLYERIFMGDMLCVCNINTFCIGAYDLYNKLDYLSSRGVAFESINERFLNFSKTKPLPQIIIQTLQNMAYREREFVRIIDTSKLPRESKNQLISRIRNEFLCDIVLMFHNNGIRRRS